MPNSLWSYGLQPTRLLCSWDFPGKDTGVFWHFHLQGISPPRDWTRVSCPAGRCFTELPGKYILIVSLIYFSRCYAIFHTLSLWLFWFFLLMFLHSCDTFTGLLMWEQSTEFLSTLMSFIASHRVTFLHLLTQYILRCIFLFHIDKDTGPLSSKQVVCIILSELFPSLFS